MLLVLISTVAFSQRYKGHLFQGHPPRTAKEKAMINEASSVFNEISRDFKRSKLREDQYGDTEMEYYTGKGGFTYGSNGLLRVFKENDLQRLYVSAKKALLACDYFENNHAFLHEKLSKARASVYFLDFENDGYKTHAGHIYAPSSCGETFLSRHKPQYITFSQMHLNYETSTYEKGLCSWETTVPHEVLHLTGLAHQSEEQNKIFWEVLNECDFMDPHNMDPWWLK